MVRPGWRPFAKERCEYRGEEVKERVVNGCPGGAFLIDHSAFRSVKYEENSAGGGSVHLSSGKSVVVTSTLFNESENFDRGSCLRAVGFSFARFEWDCFQKSRTRYMYGHGQTTSLQSQKNSSLHLSNTIIECGPDYNPGYRTIDFQEKCTHTSIISFNNFSFNKLKYRHVWYWNGIEGEGTMNTLANNEMGRIIGSSGKNNSISFTNFVGNKHSNENKGLFFVSSGPLIVINSFIISNDYTRYFDIDGTSPTFKDTLFYKNTFSIDPTATSLPFTYSLNVNHVWDCLVKAQFSTRKFSFQGVLLGKDIFVSIYIVDD